MNGQLQEGPGLDMPMNPRTYGGKEVYINPCTHGYLVTIGCVTFAVAEGDNKEQSIEWMLEKIKTYLKNPEEAEKNYNQTGKY